MFADSSKRRRVGAVLLAAVTAAAMTGCSAISSLTSSSEGDSIGYIEEVATVRDISNYSSFTGSITPVTEVDIIPDLTGVKVTELYVAEGDEVKEGDVLMLLDDSSIQDSIESLELSISQTESKNAISLQQSLASLEQAQQNLDNYLQDIEDGLNSTLRQAESSLESAYQSLVSAIETYNSEVALNNQDLSTTMLNAQDQVDSAYEKLQEVYLSISRYEEDWQITLEETEGDVTDAQQLAYDRAMEDYETELAQAQADYDSAVTNYQIALISEDNTLTNNYYSLIKAEISYLDSVDDYNTAVRTVQRQIISYQQSLENAELSYESTLLSTDMTSTYDELEDLYESLEDCQVKATMDGVITTLSVSVGSIVSSTTASAVISSFDEFMVEISVNEYDITSINEGDAVTVTVDAIEKDYEGYISSISRVASVSSGVSYFTAEVKFEGDDDSRSGMSCEITLVSSEALGAVTISAAAIQTATDGSSYVLMYGDGDGDTENLVQQTVTTGVTNGTYTEITEGLEEGDVVLYSATAAAASTTDDTTTEDFSNMGGGMDMGGGGGGDMGGGGGGMPGGM